MGYDEWKTTEPTRPRRRGDTLYCYCDACGKTETFSCRELNHENGDTGFRTCEYCEMELCEDCFESSVCWEKDGKEFNHEQTEIKPEEERSDQS